MGEHLFNTQKGAGSNPATPTKYGETEHVVSPSDCKSPAWGCAGSTPALPTIQVKNIVIAYTI